MNLKELILQNPELPIIFYNKNVIDRYFKELNTDIEIKLLTNYDGGLVDEDEYREKLWDDLCSIEEYCDLSDEDCKKMIDKKVSETQFEKAIVVYVD